MRSKYPSSARTDALLRARHFVNGCVTCVNGAGVVAMLCCDKRVAGTVAIYCADVMSNDVVGTQERQLSSSKSIKQKCPLVYYSETKLLSEVSIILANVNE